MKISPDPCFSPRSGLVSLRSCEQATGWGSMGSRITSIERLMLEEDSITSSMRSPELRMATTCREETIIEAPAERLVVVVVVVVLVMVVDHRWWSSMEGRREEGHI